MWLAARSASPHLHWQTCSLSLVTWEAIPIFSADWNHIPILPLLDTSFCVSYLNWQDNQLAKYAVNLSGMCDLCYKNADIYFELFLSIYFQVEKDMLGSLCIFFWLGKQKKKMWKPWWAYNERMDRCKLVSYELYYYTSRLYSLEVDVSTVLYCVELSSGSVTGLTSQQQQKNP